MSFTIPDPAIQLAIFRNGRIADGASTARDSAEKFMDFVSDLVEAPGDTRRDVELDLHRLFGRVYRALDEGVKAAISASAIEGFQADTIEGALAEFKAEFVRMKAELFESADQLEHAIPLITRAVADANVADHHPDIPRESMHHEIVAERARQLAEADRVRDADMRERLARVTEAGQDIKGLEPRDRSVMQSRLEQFCSTMRTRLERFAEILDDAHVQPRHEDEAASGMPRMRLGR